MPTLQEKNPGKSADQLLRLAHRRTHPPGSEPALLSYVLTQRSKLRLDQLLVPEEWTLGYHTPYYGTLSEAEKLALNHWIYCIYYTRFARGEVYVSRTNAVLAQAIESHQPALARLLWLESQEELDHIQSFSCIIETILESYGLARLPAPQKPFAAALSHPRCIRALWKVFGVDYLVAYFLGRGITNHQGVGYERPISRMDDNRDVVRISRLHCAHESQHMAVSQLMSQAARELLPKPLKPRSKLYQRAYSQLQKTIASYAFSQARGNAVEAGCAKASLHRIPALRHRPRQFLDKLVDEHYAAPTGLQQSQNKTLTRDNDHILRLAAIRDEDQALWRSTLRQVQGHLRYVPAQEAPA